MGAAKMMEFYKPGGILVRLTDDDEQIVSRWEQCDKCIAKVDVSDGMFIGDFLWMCFKCEPRVKR
jgi:hypothetical protein